MSEFIIKRSDGTKRKVSGYEYASPSPDSKKYKTGRYGDDDLPSKVDLREYMTEVEDQQQLNSCTANAVAGAYEYLVKRHQDIEDFNVSRLFVYYNARYYKDRQDKDCGSAICMAIKSLQEYGACTEETWPYDMEMVLEQPSEEAYEEAGQFLVDDTELIPTDLYAWRHAIAEGYPIIFGVSLFGSFDKQKKRGLVPNPTPSETSREDHGKHAMLCVGYSDKDRLFIVRNSWGSGWGDEGYCYIPYSYLMNEQYNLGDSWIIRQVEEIPDSEELWGDDESLLSDLQTELSEMDNDTWQEMLEEMGDYGVEYRLAQLLLLSVGSDGEFSEEELTEVAKYMTGLLEMLGIDMDAGDILENCMDDVANEELMTESIDIFGRYLSATALATIIADAQRIAGVDGLDENEESFVNALVEAWQIEE